MEESIERKRSRNHAIAFTVFSSVFSLYWILFLVFGLIKNPNRAILYSLLSGVELLMNAGMLFFAIRSFLPKYENKCTRYFILEIAILSVATFPMPFAYLFGGGFVNTPLGNEIAAIATPACVMCFLALVFSCAALVKYQDSPVFKSFLQLAIISLLSASIYIFLCLIYKSATSASSDPLSTDIYVYALLAFLYIALSIYALVTSKQESDIPTDSNDPRASKKSLFGYLNGAFLVYSILSLAADCYYLGDAFTNERITLSVRFGEITQGSLIGDYLFLSLIHLFMLLYSFFSLHERNAKRDPLFSSSVLLTLLALSFLMPGIIGDYGLITRSLNSKEFLSPIISMNNSLVCFAAMAFGTALASMFLVRVRRKESALYLAVSSFMVLGIYLSSLAGTIYSFATSSLDWFEGLVLLLYSLLDCSVAIFSLVVLGREYPRVVSNGEKNG